MRIEKGMMIALGYGKYFRSDGILGLEPVADEDGRGPGRRTYVYAEGRPEPFIASRSEGAILRDMVEGTGEVVQTREQYELLTEILETVQEIDPLLRRIVREQGNWDLDLLERRIRETVRGS